MLRKRPLESLKLSPQFIKTGASVETLLRKHCIEFRLRLHEIGVIQFHLDRFYSGSAGLNCVGYAWSRYHPGTLAPWNGTNSVSPSHFCYPIPKVKSFCQTQVSSASRFCRFLYHFIAKGTPKQCKNHRTLSGFSGWQFYKKQQPFAYERPGWKVKNKIGKQQEWTILPKEVWYNLRNFLPWSLAHPKISNVITLSFDNCRVSA